MSRALASARSAGASMRATFETVVVRKRRPLVDVTFADSTTQSAERESAEQARCALAERESAELARCALAERESAELARCATAERESAELARCATAERESAELMRCAVAKRESADTPVTPPERTPAPRKRARKQKNPQRAPFR